MVCFYRFQSKEQKKEKVCIIQPIRRIQIDKKKKGVFENKNGVTEAKANIQKGNF